MTASIRFASLRPLAAFAALAALAGISACVKAPNISVVDSKTALERQAAGEYPTLENDLGQAGASPRAEPIPGEELTNGTDDTATLGDVARLYADSTQDADWIDQMLVEGCIGEASSGLLEPTPDQCSIRVDEAERVRILGRANLHRRQVWRYLAEQRPEASPAQIRAAWRKNHVERVVCGGLLETDGQWKAKPCD